MNLLKTQHYLHTRELTLGLTIGISKLKAVYLGRKSIVKYIDKALELDPENIQGNIEKGNSLYYCPINFWW